ncbi:Transposase [Mycetohabitans rhizoxinica HKI 454]|uniref:Transposase n=1 Tax=Mycetohabitans rhizoxinica (strain DSM 19002 / CIP 109453 / HKI 454) TaxID=882378 RepID=E5ARR7_MYCRK|nr:Transposase [Mycetohabitans rhizoxinica HKI 454]
MQRAVAVALEAGEATKDGGDTGSEDHAGQTERHLKYGFIADQLADGSKFRTLTIVGVFTKEALAIKAGQRLRGEHVVSALNRITARSGAPRHLFVDNGSEFSWRLLDIWAYHHRAKVDFTRPGKPTDN